MRILIVSDNYPPETNAGASRSGEHARHWAAFGHDVTVITCAPNFPQGRLFPGYRNWPRQVEQREGVRVVRVGTFMAPNRGVVLRLLDFLSFMVAAWCAGLWERRPDVVLATSPQFFAALAGWGLAAVRRVPFVFELRDLWPASVAAVGVVRVGLALRAFERVELFLYRRAARVLAVTEAFRENLVARGIPAARIAVVTAGADLARFRPQPRDEALAARLGLAGCFVVGYLGTHGMAHGLHAVLEAAALLRDVPAVRFLLVGDGAERAALLERARRGGLSNVVFEGPQPKERMPAYWSLCDVALISLRNEALFADVLPSKIFEAMAMGLPLLLSLPRGEATALVERHGAGRCVPPEQPAALAAAVRALAQDAAGRAALAAASLAAAPQYDRRRGAERIEALLRDVVAGRPAPGQGA